MQQFIGWAQRKGELRRRHKKRTQWLNQKMEEGTVIGFSNRSSTRIINRFHGRNLGLSERNSTEAKTAVSAFNGYNGYDAAVTSGTVTKMKFDSSCFAAVLIKSLG